MPVFSCRCVSFAVVSFTVFLYILCLCPYQSVQRTSYYKCYISDCKCHWGSVGCMGFRELFLKPPSRVKPPNPQTRTIVNTKHKYQPHPSLIPYRHWLWFCNAKRDPYCNSPIKTLTHKNSKTICTIGLEIYAWRWLMRVETCSKVNIYILYWN